MAKRGRPPGKRLSGSQGTSVFVSYMPGDKPHAKKIKRAIKESDRAIGERVQHVRKEMLGYDRQSDFAQELAVSRGAVGNWEQGKGVKRENLERVSERFDISLNWLATGKGTPRARPSLDSLMDELPAEEIELLMDDIKALIEVRLNRLKKNCCE